MRIPYTSHETFSHDSIDSLGYDWERIADPGIAPRFPSKLYLPRSVDDVVGAIRETRQLGQDMTIRSKGHSSNDLVLNEGGAVLCTEKLNRIVEIDPEGLSAKVQSGAILAEVDASLAQQGLGLPVIGDHNHITAGGFASVGGISPASHRHGLFVDNVRGLTYVDWNGDVIECRRDGDRAALERVLAGTGRHGVIVDLTLDVIRIDKAWTILENRRGLFRKLDAFLEESSRLIAEPGDVRMERGVWLDYPVGGSTIRVGQFSSYAETAQTAMKRLRNRVAYGYLHFLGRWAGRLPRAIDVAAKALGMVGIILSPRYASVRNIESFTDKVLDSTVGDPTRMLIVLAPATKYDFLFRRLYELCLAHRTRYGCFTFLSFYVKAIRSPYLAHGAEDARFCELMIYAGVRPDRMTQPVLESLVSQIDDLCVGHDAFRYMHTRTVKDARLEKIDPNRRFHS